MRPTIPLQPMLTIRNQNLPTGILSIFAVLLACFVIGQSGTLDSVRLDSEDEHELFVIPNLEEASKLKFERDNFEIEIESKDDRVKYEAREFGSNDEPIVHYEVESDEPVHLVFDTKQRKFQRLTNNVRVVLVDYLNLDSLIEETDAESGKAYPKLGYAILNLPTDKHPAKFVQVLEKRTEVESAFVIIAEPPLVPQ